MNELVERIAYFADDENAVLSAQIVCRTAYVSRKALSQAFTLIGRVKYSFFVQAEELTISVQAYCITRSFTA
ncbi:hypothetical protein G8759_10160 [Spirosoma aureum]|uniref:Uncharacterized protein n=1 Tax=Spirosoma aureum TaxID=2692134 RepID=A0A6G9AKG5_9BACT|nr:hypothetical protein [Spirosoma aureum]QIP12962.1 hypothetical protein G8759_10160 [Spirosoma aureum]